MRYLILQSVARHPGHGEGFILLVRVFIIDTLFGLYSILRVVRSCDICQSYCQEQIESQIIFDTSLGSGCYAACFALIQLQSSVCQFLHEVQYHASHS